MNTNLKQRTRNQFIITVSLRGLKKLVLVAAAICTSVSICSASATNVYIAQNSAGAGSGADCADALPVSSFNDAANWGSGPSQIGPGTTVHLCGTFIGSAGSTMLTFRGSGTAGNPITLRFEPGAKLIAPYWNNINNNSGAIVAINVNYIVIDGGTNAVGGASLIISAANGTGLANHQPSAAIYLGNGNNITVQNMTMGPMYVHLASPDDTNGDPSDGIHYQGAGPNIIFHHNYITDASSCMTADQANSTMTNITFSANITRNCRWHIRADADFGNGGVQNVYEFGNDASGWENWYTSGGGFHLDGFWCAATTSGGSFTGCYIYNNYIHGYMDGCVGTAFLYVAGNVSNSYIFNNVFEYDIGVPGSGCGSPVIGPGGGLITFGSDSPTPGSPHDVHVDNNTFYCSTDCVAVGYGAIIPGVTEENNIFWLANANGINGRSQVHSSSYGQFSNGTGIVLTINYNDAYFPAALNQSNTTFAQGTNSGPVKANFTQWQAYSNTGSTFDTNSMTSNPLLATNLTASSPKTAFVIGSSGSPATQLGINLHGTCNGQPVPGLGALCQDALGNARPSSGNWDAGAYNFGATPNLPPAPPTGVTITVQ